MTPFLLGFAVLALTALGWTTAAGRIGVAFLGGHGFVAVGAALTYICGRLGLPPLLGVVVAVVVGGCAGAANAVVTRRSSPLVAAGATLMVGALLAAISAEIVGLAVHSKTVVAGAIGPANIDLQAVRDAPLGGGGIAAGVGLLAVATLAVALYLFSNSRTALVLRGSITRTDYVGGLGLVVGSARAFAWAVVGVAFAVAGALDAWGRAATVVVEPGELFHWTVPAVAVAGLAGLGEPLSAVVVALLYSVVERLVPGTGTAWPTVALVGSVVVMVRWPKGLAGLERSWLPLGSPSSRRFADATRTDATRTAVATAVLEEGSDGSALSR